MIARQVCILCRSTSSVLRWRRHALIDYLLTRSSSSTSLLDNESIEEFQRNGAVRLKQVFDAHWVEQVASGIQKSLDTPSAYSDSIKDADGSGLFFNDYCKWESIPEFRNFVLNSVCGELAGRLMKSKQAVFFHDHVFVKKSGTQRSTPWHQDQPYYGIDGFQNCSIWMPVTSVKKETSLQFVKGSHRWNKNFIPTKFETLMEYDTTDKNTGQYLSLPERLIAEHEILSWALEPGDCVAFHMQTVHGTSNAVSPTTRMVLVTRWLGDDCTIADRPWTTSPPKEAFNAELKPGTPVADIGLFPTVWANPDI